MLKYVLIALGSTIALSSALSLAAYDSLLLQPLLAAWTLSLSHGMAAAFINRNALTKKPDKFLVWGLGMNGVRGLLLLALIFLAKALGVQHFMLFLEATLIGYFCFLFSEIAALSIFSTRENA